MPRYSDIKKILVIGSGPIVIGQAAEFDYAGTQACRALKAEGLEVVLINSNPATIMTDKAMADKIYIEPLTPQVVKRIIEIEKPDSVLPTLGGQTGLNLAMALAEDGFFEQHNVKLLGAVPETIKKAEDRQLFKDTMEKLNQPCIPSKVVNNIEDALAFAVEIDYPVIVRPAYTLGGTGGGIAYDPEQLLDIGTGGLHASPITQVLIEKCISGWKEVEYEVMRDSKGNVITVCNMENIDPVGVHTGDSIVVAPSQTLSDKEYQMLRTASLDIITELGICGGCNVQFALHPLSFEYAVIEVNPRVSRSSALASKATGYPIAKVATKIAIGYTLDEITNDVTGKSCACFEPALDYCVVKFPKWPFDKFVYAKKQLGTQMKATGEVMALGQNFELAMMKAVRSIELGLDTLRLAKLAFLTDSMIEKRLHNIDDERIFVVYEALYRDISPKIIHEITKIDYWFLSKFKNLANMHHTLENAGEVDYDLYKAAKHMGFLDSTIERLSGNELKYKLFATYKMVDTCAAEFEAKTPYFYSGYEGENEALEKIGTRDKKKIIVFGSGPIRIGQGIEFDYCTVHCVWALKEAGYEAVIVNNNPETVSTDFDTSDRLYFDPLTIEDVASVLETEQPDGVVVQFGGQTAIKLAKYLSTTKYPIIGTSAQSIDDAEDREKFDKLLNDCNIPRPMGETVFTTDKAVLVAEKLGYPVLLRPSYVLGGQNMIIAYTRADVEEYMTIITATKLESPVLIDKYMMGKEIEVDAICDGENILIPGIMEHIERAGVHSGDSISVYPAYSLSNRLIDCIIDYTKRLSFALNVIGLVNIQYVVYEDEVYVIEVNPRSSRTVPYISKVTGVPMVDLATKCMLGQKLNDMDFGTGLYKSADIVAVKVPVFSFPKLHDVDTMLGPEMKSTGEVLGIAKTLDEALLKGLVGAGYKMSTRGKIIISVKSEDKKEIIPLAKDLHALGFEIYATPGNAKEISSAYVPVKIVQKLSQSNEIIEMLESGEITYIISTSAKGRLPVADSVKIRRKAVERDVACLTSIDTARALIDCLKTGKQAHELDMIDITKL